MSDLLMQIWYPNDLYTWLTIGLSVCIFGNDISIRIFSSYSIASGVHSDVRLLLFQFIYHDCHHIMEEQWTNHGSHVKLGECGLHDADFKYNSGTYRGSWRLSCVMSTREACTRFCFWMELDIEWLNSTIAILPKKVKVGAMPLNEKETSCQYH